MSNVVRFPGGRYVPQAPTVDALIGELATVEIELARARIAQIRSETRQANALWTWYCFKKALFWGFVLWALCTFMAPAKAEFRNFYNANGNFAGSSIQRGKWTNFYGPNGSFAGASIRNGKWTNAYDENGRFAGSIIHSEPRRRSSGF
jgi:hypothetical protein